MEGFKKKLIHRLVLVLAGLLVACFAIIISNSYVKEATVPEFLREFIDGFQVGIAACILGALLMFAMKYFIAIRSPESLKKMYISETDERRLFIKQKTGDIGLNIISYGLIVGTAVTGNIDDTAFLALLGASLFVSLVRGTLKLYYRNKY